MTEGRSTRQLRVLPRRAGTPDDEAPTFVVGADGEGELRYDYGVEARLRHWMSLSFGDVSSVERLAPTSGDEATIDVSPDGFVVVSFPGWGAFRVTGRLTRADPWPASERIS